MNANAERWMAFSREDLQVAESIFERGLYNQVCFHSQQCVEKALKALICEQGKAPPRTHSITDLLGLLSAGQLVGLRSRLVELDDFYIPTRYPDALPGSLPSGLPGRREAEEALSLARSMLQETIRLLK